MRFWHCVAVVIVSNILLCQSDAPAIKDEYVGKHNRFKVGGLLGRGGFGEVREGEEVNTGRKVAIKFEYVKIPRVTLPTERRNYTIVKEHRGIPKIYSFGRTKDKNFRYLVMDKLSDSLAKIKKNFKHFSIKTTLMIGTQLLYRLQSVHNSGVVHRDLKPENMGTGKNRHWIYLFDFGLSKKYLDRNKKHIKERPQVPHASGPVRYMSYRSHVHREQSRKDDLESLGYVLLSFVMDHFPWDVYFGLDKDEMHQKMYKMKRDIDFKELCQGLPDEFAQYFEYVRELRFSQKPDYHRLRQIFKAGLKRIHARDDKRYDWRVHK